MPMTLPARHIWVTVVTALGGAVIGACASSGGTGGPARHGDRFTSWFRRDAVPVRRVLSAPVETVWAAVPQVFVALGYAGEPAMYAGERVYFTPTLRIEERLYQGERNSLYLDCGHTPEGAPAADAYALTFAILARVTPQDSASTLAEIIIDGTARDRVERSDPVPCTGTGRLEATILQRLETAVGR
jgi:hypothetical protein